MKISDLNVEGYGVWSGLSIERFGESLNVLYGPNEAGKTTLLQFIRSMLYGFSPARRKYLPPVHGGRPGGAIDVTGPHGRFEICRYDSVSPEGMPGEEVTLTAPDGTRQGEHFLKVLLSGVDESVFNNVFAIGLHEIQELATLGDTEAAEQLYSLSAGLDRVSLVDVLRELAASRNRILDAGGKPCQVLQLRAEREKLCADIEDLKAVNRRYGDLAAQRDQLHLEITRIEEDATRTDQESRAIELAVALRERWQRRTTLDEQLAALGPHKSMPDGATERLDALATSLERRQRRLERLATLRKETKREFAGLAINPSLWRQAARIAALKEQEPWIVRLQSQIAELQGEIGKSEADLAAQRQRLGLQPSDAPLPVVSAKSLASLRAPMKLVRQCRRRLDESQQAVATAVQSAESLERQIESALTARGQSDLNAAMDRAGGLVSQLRRRVQLDERLDQLTRYRAELEERSRQLVDRQVLPAGVLVGLGILFVVGLTLPLATFVIPAIGYTTALLSLAGGIAAAAGKVLLERSNAKQLEGCQKQLGMLQQQLDQTKEDRDVLDSQLPHGGGPIPSRLQAAERELAALEELTPLDSRRGAARQEAEAASRRVAAVEEELRAARRRWRDSLRLAGLPEQLGPKQVGRLMQYGEQLNETQRRLTHRRDELARLEKEFDAFAARIVQLASEAGVRLEPAGPIEQLRRLAEASARQEAGAARRDALRGRIRRFRAVQAKHQRAVTRLKRRRRELFAEAGVKDEPEFRQRAMECAGTKALQKNRDAIAQEIDASLASHGSEAAVRRYLEGAEAGRLEPRRDELRRRLEAAQQQLRELHERRGVLSEQLAVIAADRRLAGKILDLAVLDRRIEDAVRRWQVLAVTCCLLDAIRETYEKERQPETLCEASTYLERLTQGHYRRVWTPLGEHVLKVDDAEGNSLPVEVLSRGTREQLFLSLRLALAGSYARRGAALPLVLDDVLVNFDSDRAKAAANVLRDFAATGHQLLVFTCHEHILKLFKTLNVPVNQLPSNAESRKMAIVMERQTEEKPEVDDDAPPARRKPAAKKKAVVEEPKELEEEDELVPIVQPRRKPRRSKPKKRQPTAAFDADFFDPQEDEDAENDEEPDEDSDEDQENNDDAIWDDDEPDEDFDEIDDEDDTAA